MTKVSIMPVLDSHGATTYCAVSGDKRSIGKTPGEALDAITTQLATDETGTIVIVQSFKPDQFFRAEQQIRLADLMQQ